GDKPVVVSFNATASMDPDGTVTDYEWDFDGDSNFNEADNGEAAAQGNPTPTDVSYTVVGSFDATVRVTDNDGGKDTASVQISVSNSGPNALIQAGTLDGNVPFTVSFSAEMSTDPGGMIEDYEWDFDGDGLFNEVATEEETARGMSAPSDIDFNTPGDFNVSVRVTDDDGASDSDSTLISAHGWKVITVDDPDGNPAVNHCDMVLVDSFPAIAYCIIGTEVRYGISSTLDGADAADWTFLTVPGNTGQELSLAATVAGPAIASYLGGSSFDLTYQLADGDGSNLADWNPVVAPDTTGNTGRFPELRIVDGNPAITYWNSTDNQLRHIRSIDSRGDLIIDWLPAAIIHDAAADENIQPLETYDIIGGNPAVVYYYYDNPTDHLRFERSADTLGDGNADWTSGFNLQDDNGTGSWSCFGLKTLSGNPAVIYRNPNANQVHFRTASNAAGSAWNAGVLIAAATEVGTFGSFNLLGGVPALAYQTNANGDLKYVKSETAGGGAAADWDTVETIDSANFVGGFVKLLEVDGKPAVCYQDSTNSAIKYAIRY
ncbi:PKD domain-containing protein, partial [bacterium]|nr:PKD domain-containing protein [bacterium]